MSKLLERITKLEARSAKPEPIDIIHVIVAPDRSIEGAFRLGPDWEQIPVSEDELAALQRGEDIS